MGVFATAFAAGYARFHEGRVLPGVNVGGVALDGLDRNSAEARLRRTLPDLTAGTLTLRIADSETVIPYADIGRDYAIELLLDQALAVGRSTDPEEMLRQQVRAFVDGASIPLAVTWDARRLADRVTAAVRIAEFPAVDAAIARPGGRYVATAAVPGRAVDEAAALVMAAAAIDNLSPADVTIEVPSEAIEPQRSTPQAEAAVDRVNRLAAPMLVVANRTADTIEAATINSWSRLDPTPDGWRVVIEPGPVTQYVDLLKAEVDVAAVDATWRLAGRRFVVVPAADGQYIDREEATGAVLNALQARADGKPVGTVELPVVSVVPELSTSEAKRLVSRIEILGSWTTPFTPSGLNGFGANIRRPTELIDRTVVGPGEMFDFVEVAGPITRENGYTSGAAIINGNTKLDGVLGGGLCSTSTTIFNAASRAGLGINARRAHYYYIDRYPVGLDATIWISGRRVTTLAFTNDTLYPIVIRGIATDRRVTFEIWGVPDGRHVSFSDPEVWDEKESWTEVEYTDDLPAGETERVEYAFDGFKSLVTRTVTSADGTLLHQDTFRSNYARVIGRVLVGRAPSAPDQ
jgi:vancomycin resistance protein YoaR